MIKRMLLASLATMAMVGFAPVPSAEAIAESEPQLVTSWPQYERVYGGFVREFFEAGKPVAASVTACGR